MSQVIISKHPLVAHKLTRMRSASTEPKKFRELVREITGLLAYEATADLRIRPTTVQTPLEEAPGFDLEEKIGLVPILRAGLGMVEGIWELMPSAEVWHIGIYRDEKTLKPVQYYNKLPTAPRVAVCLILDPMLATGGSAVATADIVKRWGAVRIKFVGIIGARTKDLLILEADMRRVADRRVGCCLPGRQGGKLVFHGSHGASQLLLL